MYESEKMQGQAKIENLVWKNDELTEKTKKQDVIIKNLESENQKLK